MTRRLSALFLLLLAGLLAPAHIVKAGTVSYYGVQFDGSSSYVEAPNTFDLEDFTIIVIGNIHWTGEWQSFVNKGVHGVWFGVAGEVTPNLYLLIGNGTVWEQSHKYYTSSVFDRVTMVGARWNGVTSSIIVNGKVVSNKTYTGASFSVGDNNVVRIGNQYYSNAYPTNGTIYEVLIYNRALSDSEIQAIYNDPLHPPTTGLVLFYAPGSVDPSTNTWHDKSGNGDDGTIVGATYVPLRPVEESTPSKNAPVALSFDGTSAKVKVDAFKNMTVSQLSVVAIARGVQNKNYFRLMPFMTQYLTWGTADEGGIDCWVERHYLKLNIDNKTTVKQVTINIDDVNSDVVVPAWVVDLKDNVAKLYLNGQLVGQSDTNGITSITFSNPLWVGWRHWAPGANQTIYALLVYTRALNSSEIREIYENPENPPLDGLVLWYGPYSYDPSTGKWLNRAPIFPTVPLVEELDGTNYGATAERVSIPSASYYNAENSSPISPLNVSVEMLYNNTTISLIPSFLTLPYNTTLTLNVSATGYESRLLTIPSVINNLAVYLEPTQSNTTTNSLQPPTETISPAFKISDNYNDQGLWGGRLGIYFLTGNWSEGFRRFWTLNPMFELVLPVIFAFGIILSSYLVTRKPLVPVGTTAVMATFFGMLGIPLQLSIATPLAALFIFWIIYTLWEFYKRFERS